MMHIIYLFIIYLCLFLLITLVRYFSAVLEEMVKAEILAPAPELSMGKYTVHQKHDVNCGFFFSANCLLG